MPATPVNDTLGHLFRDHSGKMVASLCRSFGFDKIDTVEDAVQDALISAMKTWPYSGIPDDQFAWLYRTAKNRCIDILRRNNRSTVIDESLTDGVDHDAAYFRNEIGEDQLRMIFACCHPEISPDSRVALTLKIVGGFGVAEIANAFLSNSEAVTKLLSRAKARLRDLGVRMEIPEPTQLPARIDGVLKSLYLMFNEGYCASTGNELVRNDLVFEAIRLVSALASHPVTSSPTVNALAALFFFQAARMPARSDRNGTLLILAEQDRELWDKRSIARGVHHLRLSACGDMISDYHLESEIAAIYSLAARLDLTDWNRIRRAYEKLQERQFSAIRELNMIIVIGEIEGPETAYSRLLAIEEKLAQYNLYYVTKAHYEAILGRNDLAISSLGSAQKLTDNGSVRHFITAKLKTLK